VPFLGAAIGAGMGALTDVGISDDFIKQTRQKITPGSCRATPNCCNPTSRTNRKPSCAKLSAKRLTRARPRQFPNGYPRRGCWLVAFRHDPDT
jgi:hypothetical protein